MTKGGVERIGATTVEEARVAPAVIAARVDGDAYFVAFLEGLKQERPGEGP